VDVTQTPVVRARQTTEVFYFLKKNFFYIHVDIIFYVHRIAPESGVLFFVAPKTRRTTVPAVVSDFVPVSPRLLSNDLATTAVLVYPG